MSTSWYEEKTAVEIGSPADWFVILETIKREDPFWQKETQGVVNVLHSYGLDEDVDVVVSIAAATVALAIPLFHDTAGLTEQETADLATELDAGVRAIDAATRSKILAPVMTELINTSKALSYVLEDFSSLQSVFARLNNLLVEENTEFVSFHPTIGSPVDWKRMLDNRRLGSAPGGSRSAAQLLSEFDYFIGTAGSGSWVIPVLDSVDSWETDPDSIESRNIAVGKKLRDHMNAARLGLKLLEGSAEFPRGLGQPTQRGQRFTIG